MITCEKCKAEFRADHNQGYPGHVDSPGEHVAYAVLFSIVGLLLLGIGIFALRRIMFTLGFSCLAGALFSLAAVPGARKHCEAAGGGVCPSCGQKNEVKWNS